jgi:hypothetical protein
MALTQNIAPLEAHWKPTRDVFRANPNLVEENVSKTGNDSESRKVIICFNVILTLQLTIRCF